MRKIKVYLFSLFMICFSCQIFAEGPVYSRILLDETSQPREPLLALLQTLGVDHNGSLKDIVSKTQILWLQTGKERWQYEDRFEEKKAELIPLFDKMGILHSIKAKKTHYNYALMIGGYAPRLRARLDFIKDEWIRGVRFDELVFLTGQRPLDPSEDLDPSLKTESDMLVFLFNEIEMPDELRQVPVTLIDIPMTLVDGVYKRPTSTDTIRGFLKNNPKMGSCLVISSQPMVGFHDTVFRTELPEGFEIETVGIQADEKLPISVYLDNFARWLYQEEKYLSKR